MKIDSVLSASSARNNFYTLLDEVSKKSRRFVITLRGGAKAIILSPEEVEAWEETMEISANKSLVKAIEKSEAERHANKGISEKNVLKTLGIDQKDLK